MVRWQRRRRKRDVVSDVETAHSMRRLAVAFVAGIAEDGVELTWDSTEASRLDDICDAFLRTEPDDSSRHSMVMGMGAYLGELMVRHGGGKWSYDPELEAAVVEMPNELMAYPHNKVAKRLNVGPEHNIFQFYMYGLTRDLPPGSQRRGLR